MGRRLRRTDRDGGQLMILAGIILTMAFIATSLTLAQVSELERQAAAEKSNPITSEWRFLHDRLATNLDVAVSTETTGVTLQDSIVPRISATFRSVQEEKGYDTVIRLAGDGFAKNEWGELVVAGSYSPKAFTRDGTLVTAAAQDDANDGIIWETPCPMDPASGSPCIVGVYLYVRLADPATAVEETILFAVNKP